MTERADRTRPDEFQPLSPTSARRRLLLLVFGPVVWVVALVILAIVLHRTDAVEAALAIFVVTFAVAVVVHWLTRRHRVRKERRA